MSGNTNYLQVNMQIDSSDVRNVTFSCAQIEYSTTSQEIIQDGLCKYNVILRRSCNHCCRGKAIGIKYYQCVFVAVSIQNEKRIRHIILWSVACLFPPHFCTLSHKWKDFRKKKNIEHEMCALVFSTTSVWNISHSKKNSASYCHYVHRA
jgi:hypothetical protein